MDLGHILLILNAVLIYFISFSKEDACAGKHRIFFFAYLVMGKSMVKIKLFMHRTRLKCGENRKSNGKVTL